MTEILLCFYKQFVSYDRAMTEKTRQCFCAHMVDFRRPGHICSLNCKNGILKWQLLKQDKNRVSKYKISKQTFALKNKHLRTYKTLQAHRV